MKSEPEQLAMFKRMNGIAKGNPPSASDRSSAAA